MVNYFNPLPIKYLKKRFDPLFKIVRSRQSGCFIGLPESAKGGYFKFILENEDVLSSFLGKQKDKHKILYFDPIPFINSNPYHWLFQLSIKLEILDKEYKHTQTEDPVIILTNIQKYLIDLSKKNSHLCLILSKPKVWENLPEEVGYCLKAVWDVKRQPPKNPCSFVFFLHSISPSIDEIPDFFNPILLGLNENNIYFPVLDKEETLYTIDRFLSFNGLKLDRKYKRLIFECSGGYYPLITNTIKVCAALNKKTVINKRFIKALFNNKVILKDLQRLWDSLSIDQKLELQLSAKGVNSKSIYESTLIKLGLLSKSGEIKSIWLKSFVSEKRYKIDELKVIIQEKKYLKGKEYILFQLFKKNMNITISRDEIADLLWGKDVQVKYSDWAIDKIISRIRKKMKQNYSNYSIITIKDKGYVMV